ATVAGSRETFWVGGRGTVYGSRYVGVLFSWLLWLEVRRLFGSGAEVRFTGAGGAAYLGS
ncbi:MAG: hypothetical protein KDC24_15365, partial [Saprospiraceae bacterium]|nr:hypothetical protein [Saprospiraceae bacterium]